MKKPAINPRARRAPAKGANAHALTAQPERCRAKTREGKPCPANPVHGRKFCYWHIPGNASLKGTIGGRRRAIFNPNNLEPLPTPQNAEELLRLMMQTVVEVRTTKLDTRTANAIFYGGVSCLAALETVNLDARLKALETRHTTLEKQRRTGR